VSPVALRLSKRFKSCSIADVSEGMHVFAGGGIVAAGGAEEECCFADTEAGTNDIIEVVGLGTLTGCVLP